MRKIIGMQLEKSMEKWGACSQSVKTIKIEDFPNATLFLLYHQTEKQLVLALHCFAQQHRGTRSVSYNQFIENSSKNNISSQQIVSYFLQIFVPIFLVGLK